MTIASPRRPADHPDRHIDCQEAIEADLSEVEAAATAAGWSEEEVALAMLDLVKARLLALLADRETARQIMRAKERN